MKKARAQWYNPRDGRFVYIGEYTNNDIQEFVSPANYDRDDLVLVLDDESKYSNCLRRVKLRQ